MAKRKTALVSHSVECSECGDVITVRDPQDLQRAKLEHMYSAHPLDMAKSLFKALPNIRTMGEALGNFLRDNVKP